jgi:hypothetical protein
MKLFFTGDLSEAQGLAKSIGSLEFYLQSLKFTIHHRAQ